MPFNEDVRLGRLTTAEIYKAKALYPMALGLQGATGEMPSDRQWNIGPIRDQGQEPMCVGFTGWAWEFTQPNDSWWDTQQPDGPTLYNLAQQNDGIPIPHWGSTVLGLLKGLNSLGLIGSYLWATTLNDVITWLSLKGPVMVGTNWYEGMFNPDANGFVQLTGNPIGGHAYMIYGVNNDERYVYCQNSWGTGWGQGGLFKMSFADLNRLLFQEGGEAACALEPSLAPPPPPPAPAPEPPTPPAPPAPNSINVTERDIATIAAALLYKFGTERVVPISNDPSPDRENFKRLIVDYQN